MPAPSNDDNSPKFRLVSPNVTLPPVAVAVAVPPLAVITCVITGSVDGIIGFNTNLPFVIKAFGSSEPILVIFTFKFVKRRFDNGS